MSILLPNLFNYKRGRRSPYYIVYTSRISCFLLRLVLRKLLTGTCLSLAAWTQAQCSPHLYKSTPPLTSSLYNHTALWSSRSTDSIMTWWAVLRPSVNSKIKKTGFNAPDWRHYNTEYMLQIKLMPQVIDRELPDTDQISIMITNT